jgi:sec-independent protein translocase protein TatB
MFDIAWSELALIAVVALVVIGPKDLPKVMRTLGQWARRARVLASEFQHNIDDMVRQSELDELREKVASVNTAATQANASVAAEAEAIQEALNVQHGHQMTTEAVTDSSGAEAAVEVPVLSPMPPVDELAIAEKVSVPVKAPEEKIS